MKKSKFLKEKRAEKVKAQSELIKVLNSRSEGEQVFTDEEQTRFDVLDTEIAGLENDIKKAERIEAAQLRAAAQAGDPVPGDDADDDAPKQRYSLHKALRSQMQNGPELTGIELEVHNIIQERAKEAGITLRGVAIPVSTFVESRADGQTVDSDAGLYGAALVATEHRGVIDLLRPNPIMAQMGATYLRGLSGNIELAVNEGGIVATWEGESDAVTATKNKYTKKEMKPKRLSATVPISLKNIHQSSIDLEAYTMSEINKQVELAVDSAAINGSGTGNVPKGILNEADVNVIAMGANGGAPTWDAIVDMETAAEVSNAGTVSAKYLINSATKGKLKTTKHNAGDANYLMTTTNEINGYAVGVSNLVPSDLTKGTGTDLSVAIFGDFKEVLIGQWGFVDVIVDEITRKKTGDVELTINSYMDVLVRQPKAFTVVKDLDLA